MVVLIAHALMRMRLLELLACPKCGGELRLDEHRTEERRWQDDVSLREVIDGTLTCQGCAADFPVRDGLPRFVATRPDEPAAAPAATSPRTAACYSYLWRFKEARMRWDYKPEGEWEYFLARTGLDAASVKGKLLLDAGCGDGRLTSSLAELGLETVGVDLSEGADIGYRRNRNPAAHYAQGDLLAPPLREGTFDVVWSAGVLHHTQDTLRAFDRCARLVKPGGRFYVWLYDKAPPQRSGLIRAMQRAPLALKRAVSSLMAAANRLKRALGGGNPVTAAQTVDEVYFWNLDMYGPEFRHLHGPREVEEWFRARGFGTPTLTDRSEYGFGVWADRPT